MQHDTHAPKKPVDPTVWLTLGLGAAAGVAGYTLFQVMTRNKVADRPFDDAPGRTAKPRPKGRFAVSGRTVTINRPRAELYAFWSDFNNLPQFMQGVRAVGIDGDTARWTIAGPLGRSAVLETRITDAIPDDRISWHSTEGSQIEAKGKVTFRDAPAGRGTEVEAIVSYVPPLGEIGRWIATLFQTDPAIQGRRELRRFKMLMETGEIATSRNHTSAD